MTVCAFIICMFIRSYNLVPFAIITQVHPVTSFFIQQMPAILKGRHSSNLKAKIKPMSIDTHQFHAAPLYTVIMLLFDAKETKHEK